jgi:hypothetical protein
MGVRVARSSGAPNVADEPSATEWGSGVPGAHSPWLDVFGILWVIVAACLALVPTFMHGSYFGTYDALSNYGLTTRTGVIPHDALSRDQINEIAPWITLAWTQVHHGHLPLWNPYEALGMPLAFNFGSGVFSLPALVSYLTPLRVVYWVQILVSFVVGGTGAYFFGRVLRLHPIACAFAATTWVLSGPFVAYLGLPDVSVISWAGWQFAAVLLILRGTHRLWSIVLFAVALAFSILAGNPQIEVLILISLAAFVVVVLLRRIGKLLGGGQIRRPVADLALASIAGVALAAPLALPGFQLAGASIRNAAPYITANPISDLLGLFFQGYWGQPLVGFFSYPLETWVWVGAIAVVLAIVAVAIRWRRPEVIGLAAADGGLYGSQCAPACRFAPEQVPIDRSHSLGSIPHPPRLLYVDLGRYRPGHPAPVARATTGRTVGTRGLWCSCGHLGVGLALRRRWQPFRKTRARASG